MEGHALERIMKSAENYVALMTCSRSPKDLAGEIASLRFAKITYLAAKGLPKEFEKLSVDAILKK